MSAKLPIEVMRAMQEAAMQRVEKRFEELLTSGAFDNIDIMSQDGKDEAQRLLGLQPATHADVRRWMDDGWFDTF